MHVLENKAINATLVIKESNYQEKENRKWSKIIRKSAKKCLPNL